MYTDMITQNNFETIAQDLGAHSTRLILPPDTSRMACVVGHAVFDTDGDAQAFAELCSESAVVERAECTSLFSTTATVRFM